ncbi:hypothetical protein CR513_34096, partial [Mucuna pruriens]
MNTERGSTSCVQLVFITKLVSSNTQQFGVRGSTTSRVVNERLENKITELTSLIRQLVIGQHYISPPTRVCGICAFMEHLKDM